MVTYVGEIYKEDLALQKELAAEMETQGYTKIKAPKSIVNTGEQATIGATVKSWPIFSAQFNKYNEKPFIIPDQMNQLYLIVKLGSLLPSAL